MKLIIICILFSLAIFAGPAAIETPTSMGIKVDQVGYLPAFPKIALVTARTDSTEFVVRNASDQKAVFTGRLSEAANDPDSGDRVQAADFTPLDKAGSYFVEVPGVGRSYEFKIGPSVYLRAYYLAMRAFYGQRCGTAVDLGAEFPGYKHGPCHLNGSYHASSGKSGAHVSKAGWHDAGDYGRYIVNSGITTGTLLWTYEMFAPSIGRVSLDIPESDNGTPDILNEIRWNLDWMLTMQDEDGGVWHKQTSDHFSGFVMPEKDTLVSYVIGSGKEPFKTSCATADFAAVMAIAGRVYKPFDGSYATKSLRAAERAYAWVDKNPDAVYTNPPGVNTGAYGDSNCADERLWAAAELWRTTHEPRYNEYFLKQYGQFKKTLADGRPENWNSLAPMALWTYALASHHDTAALNDIRTAILQSADKLVDRTTHNGYRVSLSTKDYVWGSNGIVGDYAVSLLVANAIRNDRRYVASALDDLHYLLGRNTFALSFVTQLGSNPYRHPHHRPSGADANPEPWPGLLSGGPNSHKQDAALQRLPDLPPAKVYVDDQDSYASNEVAINWQASLVFLLAGVMSAR
ncbi:MAG TPA: glycoside hydrolase family 9 protein [Bryobacteraceae bacterium]|nr:glycoside hydrolase family 9 protein [Bryobacteraceae bacterium]